MRSPKLSKETKQNIAKECIENGKNYKEICVKYGATLDLNNAKSEKEILDKYLTVDELKSKCRIKYICNVLELNRSSYYNYLNTKDIEKDIELIETIKTIGKEVNYTYGRKRMTIAVNKRLNSKFNEKISTDVTEINTGEGKIYLSGIIDMHSKSLITYNIGNSNNNEFVFNNFKDFINNNDIDLSNITLQSDRGFQYTSYGFKQIIKEMKHSMNRPGHCSDNTPIESFWGTFKAEWYYNPLLKDRFKTKEEAIKTIEDYIYFYNNVRINLKGTTPNQIRNNSLNL